MPYDAETYTPAIAPTEEPWRTVLRDAADLLERNGWCQFAMNKEKNICVYTAIERAGPDMLGPCRDKMLQYLDVTSIINWNDTAGRTSNQVIAALRSCAAS